MRNKKEFLEFRINNMINLILLSQNLPHYDIRDIDSIIDHFKNGNLGLNKDEEKPLRKRLEISY
jgi:hypothetical protein